MATNVVVHLKRGESGERLVRRFIKKCKKERILETYRQRTDHYIKPAVKRKLKREKAQRLAKRNEAKRNNKRFR
jgi:ribosomal protein S21